MDNLIQTLCAISDPKEMLIFLDEVLTPTERKNLLLRWQLMEMLNDNVPQRDIAATLHISLCKITRGAKILKNPQSIARRYIEQLKKDAASKSSAPF